MTNDRKHDITNEMLAAFLDGNTSAADTMRVIEAADHDPELSDVIRLAADIDADLALKRSGRTAPLPLPDAALPMPAAMPMPAAALPVGALAARRGDGYLCDIECEEFVLRQLGIESTHLSLLDTACRNRWMKDRGMPLYNIGRLLEKHRLAVSRRYDATTADLRGWIAEGYQVIAVVAEDVLYDVLPPGMDMPAPDHAVVVHAVEGDDVVLFDPDTEEELTPTHISFFETAWATSQHYVVVVNTAERFVYDPSPIRLDDVSLPAGLDDLEEAIAENAHEVWAKARQSEGWTYGPERDDALRQTHDMLPYCLLPEEEKRYDRDMATQTLKLVQKLGYEIRRKQS